MVRRSLVMFALTMLATLATLTPFAPFALIGERAAFAAPEADRTAARHFADGQKAFAAGDFPHAGDEFEAAYRDKPHHAPLWNAARSWQRAGEEVRAANLYARYLREAPPDAPDRDQATASLRLLTGRLGRIEPIAAGVDKLRLDNKDVDAPVVYVAPGEHVAEADDHGTSLRKVVTVRAGEQVSVTFAPEPKAAPLIGPTRDGRGGRDSRDELPPQHAKKPLPPLVPILGAALTLVGGGLAVASGLDTISKRHSFPDDRTQQHLDDARSSQTRTNVAIGVTVGLGVITGLIAVFFTDWSGGRAAERNDVAAVAAQAAPR